MSIDAELLSELLHDLSNSLGAAKLMCDIGCGCGQQTQCSASLAKAIKQLTKLKQLTNCDGDHAAPECMDQGCWHRCPTCKGYWLDGDACCLLVADVCNNDE